MNIGDEILKIRKNNKISQEELAEILSVTRQTISNWENKKSYPDLDAIIKISNKFGVSLDILLKKDSNMIKEIDTKVKKNKLLKIIIIVLVIIFLITSISVYFYEKSHPKLSISLNEISEGNAIYTLNVDKIINLTDLEKLDYINIYIVDDNIKSKELNNPLLSNVKVIDVKSNNGSKIDNIGDIKYILISIPENILKILHIAEISKSNLKIESSVKTNIEVNYDLIYTILNYYNKN